VSPASSTAEPTTRGTKLPPGNARYAASRRLIRALMVRPELTAGIGTVLVFVYFAVSAGSNGFLTAGGTWNYLSIAAQLGILAGPVALLLIGGEFDLSVGAVVSTTGIVMAYPVVYHGWPMWAGVLLAVATAAGIGAINGILVTRSRIPSFLVTLAMMFVLQGVTLVFTKAVSGQTAISGISKSVGGEFTHGLFGGDLYGVPAVVLWWLGVTAVCSYVLQVSRRGNWVYAAGGNPDAAERVGVPIKRVKIALFMGTAVSASIVAVLSAVLVDQAQIGTGTGLEFQAVVAAVIGGCLISGGYGSPLGAAFGALLFGIVSQGFFFTNIDNNWFYAFLGIMLLAAVAINQLTRSRVMKAAE
jgi:simple sugar transport system permease protein